MNLARRAPAEAAGTALLLAAVVGSGIMAQRLDGGNAAIALLAMQLRPEARWLRSFSPSARSRARISVAALIERSSGRQSTPISVNFRELRDLRMIATA